MDPTHSRVAFLNQRSDRSPDSRGPQRPSRSHAYCPSPPRPSPLRSRRGPRCAPGRRGHGGPRWWRTEAIASGRWRWPACCWALLVGRPAGADDKAPALHDGFESERTAWRIEKNDSEVRLFAHDRSRRVVREGQLAEHFQFEAGPGGDGFYVSYALPKVPLTDDLKISLQVRADRPGAQLLARVILPGDVDPETNKPSFVMVGGSTLQAGESWQRLELHELSKGAEGQARVLRASTKRRINVEGAYLDRLVVNLYGGPGSTEVYLDELRVEPVEAATAEAFARAVRARDAGEMPPLPSADAPPADEAPAAKPGAAVAMQRNLLTKQGRPWLPTIIRASWADPVKLRRAGFDVLAIPADAEPEAIKAAAAAGLMLMPEIDPGRDGAGLAPASVRRLVEQFPARDSVAFWSLGRNLGASISLEARKRERQRVVDAAHALRELKDAPNLSAAEVAGLFQQYARVPDHIDVIGARPSGWGTTQELLHMLNYLEQRRDLTALENADALIAAWLDLAPDPAFARSIWGRDRPPSWGVPRVHPDQLHQAAFVALSAGCRALGFDADVDLTKGAGRALLIEAALINEEVDLLEWLLADTAKSAQMVATYRPDIVIGPAASGLGAMRNKQSRKPETPPHETIKAAVFGTKDKRGAVMLVTDYALGSQYQPPQMSVKELNVDVPGLPDEAIAYEISPGDVQVIPSKRTPGGIKLRIPEFGGTAIVFLTTDAAPVADLQRGVAGNRAVAVNLLIEQVELLRAQTMEVHRLLLDDGHPIRKSVTPELLAAIDDSLKAAQDARERLDYAEAWVQARRARRGLTHLMRLHWEDAQEDFVKLLSDPKSTAGRGRRPASPRRPSVSSASTASRP